MSHSHNAQISHKTGAMRRCEAWKVKRVGEAVGTREDGNLSGKADEMRAELEKCKTEEALRLKSEDFFKGIEPEKLPPISGPVTLSDGTVIRPMAQRGGVLHEAINIINGERQDVYGSPEDSFALIGQYWGVFLSSRGMRGPDGEKDVEISPKSVALMMTLFKIAREANQHKRDNIIDAAGYLGIYADMQGEE